MKLLSYYYFWSNKLGIKRVRELFGHTVEDESDGSNAEEDFTEIKESEEEINYLDLDLDLESDSESNSESDS